MPFPPETPSSIDDPDAIRDHDWAAFRAQDRMHDHWDRPGWTPGRSSYHWMITTTGNHALDALVSRCQQALAGIPALDPVPHDALHITLGRISFTDETSAEVIDQIAERARDACSELVRFDLAAGPLTGSAGALRFSLSPWRPLLRLHTALTHATTTVLGDTTPMDTAAFRPHLSIAYANNDIAAAPLSALMEPLRALPPVTVPVDLARLVHLRRADRAYRYQPRHEVPLQP